MSLTSSLLPVLPAVTDAIAYKVQLQPATNTRTNALYIAPALTFTPATSLLSTSGNITALGLTVNNAATIGGILTIAGNVIISGSVASSVTAYGNVYAAGASNRLGFTWANSVSSSYTVFNSATNSVDLVFG
jgi:hypothetical protein